MQKLLRLCLWQVVLSIVTVSTLSVSLPAFSQGIEAEEERGIRMRGPKESDVFPYDKYGPITKTDTLWKIALTVRPDNRLTVYQVMQALYQANPQAFVESNLNHLVEGQYLKIPSFNQMMAINPAVAQKKSDQDEKSWQKRKPKTLKTVINQPIEPVVNKKDLDTVKVEINDQLQKIDTEQQQRLQSIQSDVLDSIDGLQAILKENEELRQRLSTFNNQLDTMQKEVAKSKEIKLQMDDMIKLQQALLAKAQAREQELLLEKQQAELEKSNIFSSLWFIVLMATLPAILIITVVVLFLKRRRGEPTPAKENSAKQPIEAESEETDFSDDLSLDEELSLDDDLSVDLFEDDAIQLDDDDELDDLDGLEDILLDDSTDFSDSEKLEVDDLDALLESPSNEEELATGDKESTDEALEDSELDQNELDDLLGSLDEELSPEVEDAQVEDAQSEITDPDDIDALLETVDVKETSAPTAPEVEDAQSEITDPDDIDALLESMGTNKGAPKEITDSKEIDDILDSIDVEESKQAQKEMATDDENSNKAKIENLTEEYVAPLLATDFTNIINNAPDSDPAVTEEETANDELAEEELDIDALMTDEPSGDFDEEELAELLNDTATEQTADLTPDFSDQKILADLLNEGEESDESSLSETTEIGDIEELDNLEFDQLLANIEEESSADNQQADFNQNDGLEPPVSLDDFDDPNSGLAEAATEGNNEDEQDFVSVDSLLSASEDVQPTEEPYNEANIDVGLNEYPEFSSGANQVDVDDDESGMVAKLDLAKVYIDIGDQDNAQIILQEVTKQGNSQQQLEAQTLLDNL